MLVYKASKIAVADLWLKERGIRETGGLTQNRYQEEYELILELLPVESSSQLPLNEDEVGEPPERFAIILAICLKVDNSYINP